MQRTLHFRSPSLLRLGALLLICTCLSACADLSAIAKFAKSAKAASTGFSDITPDFAASDIRRSLYVREDERPAILQSAEHWKSVQPDFDAAQKVLADYIAALVAVSTDSAKERDASIKASASGLKKIGLSSSQADAGVSLATSITNALTLGYRSNRAGKVIHDANPYLQDYLLGLEHIIGTDYIETLKIEQTSAEGHYDSLLHHYGEKEPLASTLIRRQAEADKDEILRKQKAAEAYVKILKDVGEAHQKLYDTGRQMTAKQYATLIEPCVEDIATQSEKMRKAF